MKRTWHSGGCFKKNTQCTQPPNDEICSYKSIGPSPANELFQACSWFGVKATWPLWSRRALLIAVSTSRLMCWYNVCRHKVWLHVYYASFFQIDSLQTFSDCQWPVWQTLLGVCLVCTLFLIGWTLLEKSPTPPPIWRKYEHKVENSLRSSKLSNNSISGFLQQRPREAPVTLPLRACPQLVW